MSKINRYSFNGFKKHIFAIAALAALSPQFAQALSLAQAPPGKVNPRVAPNVIISLDNSGSMDGSMSKTDSTKRMTILKNALNAVFDDTTLLPDKQIRLAWQVMEKDAANIKGTMVDLNENSASLAISQSSTNLMRVLDNEHRDRFKKFIKNLSTSGYTPTHKMVAQADAYLRAAININGPWADTPGVTLHEKNRLPLGCRRNYHVLLTDGEWNRELQSTNPINYDGTENISLPNPLSTSTSPQPDIKYDLKSNQTQIYRDNDIEVSSKTNYSVIADWAFYSWAKPLQESNKLTGKVLPNNNYYSATPEKFTSKDGKSSITLEPFWNPKYNPATWPHMVTFTIGFSNDAIPKSNYNESGTKQNDITNPSSLIPYGYDGDFAHYATGKYAWKASIDKGHDMWHSAINSRGEFYSVTKADDLKKAFESIIGTINAQSEPDRSTSAATGTSAERKPVGTFMTYNEPLQAWSGGVKSHIISNGTETPAWEGRSTAEMLDRRTTERVIITSNDNGTAGLPFQWSSLSAAQKNQLKVGENQTDSDSVGEDRLNYIRGNRSKEKSNANGIFRNRVSKQGDIVNSTIWYTGAPISNFAHKGYSQFINEKKSRIPMIYVGGNDGMLHGFATKDGEEKIAYIPHGVYRNLSRLTWPSFDENHRYYVDGSPMTGDVDVGSYTTDSPEWKTLLIGALGGGGKGYFVLNVTDPDTAFTEANAANLLVMDKTLGATESISCANNNCLETDAADIGHIFSPPAKEESNPLKTNQITLLNNNRWAVVLGNGYNSVNQRPVLLIQYLDGQKELLRIPATLASAEKCTPEQLAAADGSVTNSCHNVTDNGLSAPTLVDINGDGRPDVVYAGDLKGNIWKFLISSNTSSEWGVAFNYTPLYTAVGGIQGSRSTRNMRQPISVAPTVRANDRSYNISTGQIEKVGGMMVSFGTGLNVTETDPANIDTQSIYAVLDNTRYQSTKDTATQRSYVSVHPGDSSKGIPAPTTVGLGISNLANQRIDISTKYVGEAISKDREFWGMDTSGSTTVNWTTHKGWYLDFPEQGERLLKNIELYDGSNILAIYSQVPAKGSRITANLLTESCEPSTVDEERQYLTLLNIMDGQRPTVQIMDLNGDNAYDLVTDKYVSRMRITKGAHTRVTGKEQITDFGKENAFNLARMPEQSMRPSWRQLK